MLSANQIEDIKCQAYKCLPSQFNNICKIYPVPVIEILEMGINAYNGKLGLLLLTEVEIAQTIKEKIKQDVPIEKIEQCLHVSFPGGIHLVYISFLRVNDQPVRKYILVSTALILITE